MSFGQDPKRRVQTKVRHRCRVACFVVLDGAVRFFLSPPLLFTCDRPTSKSRGRPRDSTKAPGHPIDSSLCCSVVGPRAISSVSHSLHFFFFSLPAPPRLAPRSLLFSPLVSYFPFSLQINRLSEDLRQNAPLDGNVYIAEEYHQAPHHYLRVSGDSLLSPPVGPQDVRLLMITSRMRGVPPRCTA